MTPEEIAEKIVHDYHSARRIPFDLRSAIATALREAEARGLERAAEIAAADSTWGDVMARQRAEGIAAAIRAQKERQS